jgi:hypothetical protein
MAPIAMAGALALSCGKPAALREPRVQAAPFCFALTADREGESHFSVACLDAMPLCLYARDRAIALAGIAHLTEIGECRYVEAMR